METLLKRPVIEDKKTKYEVCRKVVSYFTLNIIETKMVAIEVTADLIEFVQDSDIEDELFEEGLNLTA